MGGTMLFYLISPLDLLP